MLGYYTDFDKSLDKVSSKVLKEYESMKNIKNNQCKGFWYCMIRWVAGFGELLDALVCICTGGFVHSKFCFLCWELWWWINKEGV